VIMEAASQALPILASRFAGIPEFVRDGVEGVLVEPGGWEALSNALNLLVRDPDRRRELGEAAASRLRTAFSADSGLDWLAEKLAPATQTSPAQVPSPSWSETG
jgi:glycosyltransferase involved in cell wall biosynthesis